jgi:glucose-1-phosphate adenylyltransferase
LEEKPQQALLAPMGVYLFSMDLLLQTLEANADRFNNGNDLFQELIPALLDKTDIYTYRFGLDAGRVSPDKYWRDMQTLDDYYEANMELLNPTPALDLYQPEWPIRTYSSQYPPARTVPGVTGSEGIFINSIIAGGVIIVGGSVQHSILFPHVQIGEEAVIHDSILFNNVKVEEGAELNRCIIDKDVCIPRDERIGFDRERDAARFTISEQGVVVVPKGYNFN